MTQAPSDVLTVSQLNRLARKAIEGQIPLCWVSGEVSNFTRAPSGHWYFTLKDAQASVRCAMFKNRNQFLDWLPREGDHIEVRAVASIYEARGEFQLSVETLRRAGLGALFEAFNRLKEKLEKEGLFAPARKRELPRMPARIGIVTSSKAAALRDVLTTLRRRWPAAAVVLYPTLVQGSGAAEQIAAAIDQAGERAECDVLLIVRGGGSIEDLWAFNEEIVARAIAACPIATVSGIGHETDFTIADFVADLRAPTPTGAAQLATPDRAELAQQLDHIQRRLQFGQRRRLDNLAQRVDGLSRRLTHPAARLDNQRRHLGHLHSRLRHALSDRLQMAHRRGDQLHARLHGLRPDLGSLAQSLMYLHQRQQRSQANRLASLAARLDALGSHLHHLNPQAVLERGYSIVRDAQGRVVRDSKELKVGMEIEVTLAQGGAGAQVTRVEE
ncbi:MAG: exodeoxyribonuclease VII large subunit [Betaproteobacteria bacterium]|nr:exodeoxyribonuclease VII large subunit [Betaproteobacteria bacterium]